MSSAENASTDWIRRAEDLMPLRVRNFVDGCGSEVGGEPMHKLSPRDGALLSQFGVGEPRDVQRQSESTTDVDFE